MSPGYFRDLPGQPFDTAGGIRLGPTGTIRLHSSSGLKALLVYRDGMAFPDDPAKFAGTAIQCAIPVHPTERRDLPIADPFLQDVMILGFAVGFSCINASRPKLRGVSIDATNGILACNSWDSATFRDIHIYPYATTLLNLTTSKIGRAHV